MSVSKPNQVVASALGFLLALGAVGCDDEFTSRTVLSGYRVVGVEASPPEVTPDDTVLLTAHDFYDADGPIAYRWSLCLDASEQSGDFACDRSRFDLDLGNEQSLTVDLSPAGLGVRALLEQVGPVTDANGVARDLGRGFDVFVRLTSGPQCSGCDSITTVKRLRLRDSSEAPNQNPLIRSFDTSGTVRTGADVKLSVRTETPETYRDPETGDEVEEEYLYTWYTSSGKTDPALTFGTERETTLHLDDAREVTVFVTVRDGRGGLAVASQVLSP
jgi:hypothetical protein